MTQFSFAADQHQHQQQDQQESQSPQPQAGQATIGQPDSPAHPHSPHPYSKHQHHDHHPLPRHHHHHNHSHHRNADLAHVKQEPSESKLSPLRKDSKQDRKSHDSPENKAKVQVKDIGKYGVPLDEWQKPEAPELSNPRMNGKVSLCSRCRQKKISPVRHVWDHGERKGGLQPRKKAQNEERKGLGIPHALAGSSDGGRAPLF